MTKWIAVVALAAIACLSAGCGADPAGQVATNPLVREHVADTLAAHRELAFKTVDRFLVSDTLRVMLVDHELQNDKVAQQVIWRIAHSPQAIDAVVQVAVEDTAMRAHLVTLLKGVEMGSRRR